jgi:outer membrane protein OmpA-like peptidoglycan-associated protein
MTLKFTIAAASVSLLALAGCTENSAIQPSTGSGAAVGAVTGAVLGRTLAGSGNRTEGALLGAALGAGAGALIGQDLARQKAELDNQFASNEIDVINTGNELIVRMPQDILFAINSAAVSPALRSDLIVLADNLNRYPNSIATIVGHTDNTGTAAFNQTLSEDRALSVAAVLRSGGVASGRLRAIGAGENQPIASNLTPEGRALNRRVDITIQPQG